MPKYKYYLAGIDETVREGDRIWAAAVPMSRKAEAGAGGIALSHGEYFGAVRKFLEKSRFKILVAALSRRQGRKIVAEDLGEILIFLEKHGEFYHPARVEVKLNRSGRRISFVVNAAFSEVGKSRIEKEYHLLTSLRADLPDPCLPEVYGFDRVRVQKGAFEAKMFLGEWFTGFCEFHLSRKPGDEAQRIVVWDPERGDRYLTRDQSGEIYRQAAMILTGIYNYETFEQISSWHHAAGDFVVRCEGESIEVKLITVRQYGPMFEPETIEDMTCGNHLENRRLEALLVFFLHLALRMRLDRLDGVGEIAWSDNVAVRQTVKGVFDALALKPQAARTGVPLVEGFKKHLRTCSLDELHELTEALVDSLHPRSPDTPVIRKNIEQHVKDLYRAICEECERL